MNRLNKHLKVLYEGQNLKTIDQIINRFNERNNTLKQILSSADIPEHLRGITKERALLKILGSDDLWAIMNVGYYNACLEANASIFLNAFFTYSRLNFERAKLLSGEADHGIYFPFVIEHCAMNDFDRAKKIFKPELGTSTIGHRYAKCVSNLIMALLHDEQVFIQTATEIADKYLLLKNPNFDTTTIIFLLSIIKNDISKANDSFVEMCKAYKKSNWLHNFNNPFLKEIGIFPMGLFKLAKYYLDNVDLIIPENGILWKDFISLKVRGEPYIIFEDTLAGLNEFMK